MATRSVSISAIFGWIPGTFALVGRALPSFTGASVLTVVVGFLFSLPVLGLVGFAGFDPAAIEGAQAAAMIGRLMAGYGLMMLLYVVLYPPLMLGWLRLCQQVDRGMGASAFGIFSAYRDPQSWLRAIGLILVSLLLMLLVLGLFAAALWKPIMGLAQMSAVRTAGGTPQLPAGLGWLVLGYFAFLAAMLAIQWIQMLAFVEIALRRTGVFEALGLAAAAVGRNFLKLFVVAFCVGIVLMVVGVVLVVLIALLTAALSLVGSSAMTVGVLLLEIPLAVVMYPLMFAGFYLMWKGLLGDDSSPDALPDEGSSLAA